MRKIDEQIRELASKAIEEMVQSEDLLTVTAVETASDLKNTVIWISVLGDEKKAAENLAEKKSAIQHAITSQMYAKYTPKIEFKIDQSQKHAARIEELLK